MADYKVTNPATGEVEAEFATLTDDQLSATLDHAAETFTSWSKTELSERADLLRRAAAIYEERKDELATIITREMGKPMTQARSELDIVISIFHYYADHGAEFLADEPITDSPDGSAVMQSRPVGVLLGIMPWNFPYYQVARFAVPNLMIGNTIMLKHASQCPESAAAMEQIFRDAGFPQHAYTNVYASSAQIADIVIPDPRVAGISLTGSERAGTKVAAVAGENLKKVVLELGGNDPLLVLDREILPAAVKGAVQGRMANAGQACNAAKRVIVPAEFYDDFLEQFQQALSEIKLLDPLSEEAFIGPMSSAQAAEDLHEQVQDAVEKGATLHLGGDFDQRRGAWYQPTLLTGITREMRAYGEELFGPVAMVYKVADEEEAVKLANDTQYGLSASVFATDVEHAQRIGEQIHTGMVFVNEPAGTSAELPFGGVKRSGVGRELGPYGMAEFVNKRLVKIAGR
ncbi:NAD-dependent succinate-semialdehyde dehydrogenase [Nesterenkonia sp. DZ6]|uniref:NAD-dependent succinate-semialdehyde dehydrogenase n=1 Tax=Nesterenkonia sp. DZ6 TaxID=2901229 RepID=UPI001F4C7FF0|nr:NAD-dependent succinate-semialdehyde dehydrogenase [Nesterenkonia sp. DZ6]MCH8561548.1 NAD-dependent succinate-semialdehyde dehydrogenase [Nesterenkonia sp. DZ6]